MLGMGDMMKQAKAMQEKMAKVQEQVAALEVTGESGAGLVRVQMTGRHDVRAVTIDPALMSEDREVLEDLIAAAVNDAVRRVEGEQKALMSEVTAVTFAAGHEAVLMPYPAPLEALIEQLRVLPGVGRRSAQRMAFQLLERDRPQAQALAEGLLNALEKNFKLSAVPDTYRRFRM